MNVGKMWRVLLPMLILLIGAGATGAEAQVEDRMPPILPEELSSAQKQGVEEFEALRGTEPFGPFIPLLRSPELMVRSAAFGEYLRYRSALPLRLSEMVILLVARQWTQPYEWYVHEPIAREAGLSPESIAAIAEGRRPFNMARDEAIIYDFFDELHRNHSVTDPTYERALSEFGEQGVIDILGIVGYYTMLAMVMNTTRTALPDGVDPGLLPLPK